MFHSDLGSMGWFDVKGVGMPLYELTAPYHDCSGNIVPTPTLAPTTLYKEGAEKCNNHLWDLLVDKYFQLSF